MPSALRRFLAVGLGTASISILLNLAGKGAAGSLDTAAGLVVLLGVVLVGVLFDVIGVAATAASEHGFHAMATDRVPGAAQAVWIVRHADRVANFANDMVGDAAGTLSGALAASLVAQWRAQQPAISELWATTLLVAAVSGLTVGGKAALKGFAIRHAEQVVYAVGRLVAAAERLTGRPLLRSGSPSRTRRADRAGRAEATRRR